MHTQLSDIRTQYDPPPIPLRSHDWRAWRDDYEPGDPIGHGATEPEALEDLLTQLEEENGG